MGRTHLLITIFLLTTALPLVAQSQQQDSLGDVARQLRAQHAKDAKRATKVFTNDNLPAPVFGEPVTKMLPTPENTSPPAQAKSVTPPTSEVASNKEAEAPEDKEKTRDYWQERFRAARRDVARAKEQQQLSEDELNLLQIQQAREMNSIAKEDFTAKVQAKQTEVDVNTAATEAAQKALSDLEKEFKDSGAPEDWSQTD